MKKLLLIPAMLLISTLSFSQTPNYAWAKQSNGSADPDVSTIGGIAVDTIHNFVYATGSFDGGSIDFGSGSLNGSSGSQSAYITKRDLNGNLVWAKTFPSGYDNTVSGIAIDNAGNIYVTGYSQNDTIRFGNQYILNSHPNSTDHTVAYVLKADANGNAIWVKGSTGGGGVISNGIAVDAAGNSYITGEVATVGGTFLGNSVGGGAFFMKITTAGTSGWFTQTTPSTPLVAQGNAIALDYAGNCIVTGAYSSTVNFGSTTIPSTNGNGSYDRFTTKINTSTGAFVWAYGSGIWQGPDYNSGVSVDAQNNIYLTGYLSVATQGSNTSTFVKQQFTEKLNSAGTSQWVNTYALALLSNNTSIVADKAGNSYVTYNISDTTVYGSFTICPISPFIANSTVIIATIKHDANGHVVYAKKTNDPVVLSEAIANAIAIDLNSNVYVSGTVSETCGFDTFTLTAPSHNEALIAKLGGPLAGIEENKKDHLPFVYPNPATTTLYINNLKERSTITITDITGKVVLISETSETNNSIDVSSFTSGIYIVETASMDSRSYQKIIIK